MSLGGDSFGYVADLVRRRSGIHLAAGKEYLVESRLLGLARAAGTADVDAFVRQLRTAPSPAVLAAVVESLTTNETSWCRDGQPFQALVEVVVPHVLGDSPASAGRTVRVWSAACSTGQEPYSIAMALAGTLAPGRLRIVATDLSEQVLQRAAAGRYSQLEVNRGLPAAMLVQHFVRRGAEWEVAEALRSQVTFLRHNLLEAPPTGGPFDVVFLRNVLIYFDLATKRDVLRRVQQVLRPGGYLLLGAAETTMGVDDLWERVPGARGSVYRSTPRRAA